MNCKVYVTLFAALLQTVFASGSAMSPELKQAALTGVQSLIQRMNHISYEIEQNPRQAIGEVCTKACQDLGPYISEESRQALANLAQTAVDLDEDGFGQLLEYSMGESTMFIEAYKRVQEAIQNDSYNMDELMEIFGEYQAFIWRREKGIKAIEATVQMLESILNAVKSGNVAEVIESFQSPTVVQGFEIMKEGLIHDKIISALDAGDLAFAGMMLSHFIDNLQGIKAQIKDQQVGFDTLNLVDKLGDLHHISLVQSGNEPDPAFVAYIETQMKALKLTPAGREILHLVVKELVEKLRCIKQEIESNTAQVVMTSSEMKLHRLFFTAGVFSKEVYETMLASEVLKPEVLQEAAREKLIWAYANILGIYESILQKIETSDEDIIPKNILNQTIKYHNALHPEEPLAKEMLIELPNEQVIDEENMEDALTQKN